MKKLRIIQVFAIILIAGDLVGMWAVTDVYTEVQDRIVKILCLSCIKLEPKTTQEFTFVTANGAVHPPFMLENLTHGLVFLHYSEDVCHACDVMLPVINEFFGVSFEKIDSYSATISFMNSTVTIIYINIDHREKYLNDAFDVYDKDDIGGLPMFTVITLGYDRGIIRPYYTSLYGTLNLDTDAERMALFHSVFVDAIDLYTENVDGYSYP
ncbi:MAG: hypothetical protein KKC68_07925 [Candidatus Thermoplasmatota archaeon]|nr:hypothetical protein [Candidatus Thermoplasmatota archaeon]